MKKHYFLTILTVILFSATFCSAMEYTVKKGDTLWGIARQEQVSLSKLIQINNFYKPNEIFIGQKIVIPSDGKTIKPITQGDGIRNLPLPEDVKNQVSKNIQNGKFELISTPSSEAGKLLAARDYGTDEWVVAKVLKGGKWVSWKTDKTVAKTTAPVTAIKKTIGATNDTAPAAPMSNQLSKVESAKVVKPVADLEKTNSGGDSLSLLETFAKATFTVKKPGSSKEVVSQSYTGELMWWKKDSENPISYGIGVMGNYSAWDMSYNPTNGYSYKITPEVGVAYAKGLWYGQLKGRVGYQESVTKRTSGTTRQDGGVFGAYGEGQYKLQPDLSLIGIVDFWTGFDQSTSNGTAPASLTSLDVSAGLEKNLTPDLRWRNMVGFGYREASDNIGFAKSELRYDTSVGTLIAGVQAGTNGTIGLGIGYSGKEPIKNWYSDHRASQFNPVDESATLVASAEIPLKGKISVENINH